MSRISFAEVTGIREALLAAVEDKSTTPGELEPHATELKRKLEKVVKTRARQVSANAIRQQCTQELERGMLQLTTIRAIFSSMDTASLLPVLTSDPALARDTEELYDALEDLLRVYQFRDRDRICCFDISVSQCYALEGLVRRGSMTLNDLAAYLYLDKSTASRVVDALERKGYVARLPHPKDGRSVLLEATAKGCELEGTIRESILAEERQLLADFAPEVRQAMTLLIRRLARAASASVQAGGGSCCRIP